MSRSLRIIYPGAFYHITSRGNARKNIFRTDKDREQFLFILSETLKKHHWRCHAYCLMDNHYHLVIETVDPTLSAGMQHLNAVYTQWHNAEHHRVGHLFQGRFKAFLIEEQSYLLNVARYVVLNPVRAKIVANPSDYQWSSYRATAGLDRVVDWLTTKTVLGYLSNKKLVAQSLYKNYVDEGIDLSSPLKEAGRGGIVGSDQFISEMRDYIGPRRAGEDVAIAQRMVGRPTLQQIFDGVVGKRERNAGIVLAVSYLHYSAVEVGRFLKLDGSTVAAVARECKQNPRSQA